MPAPDQPRPQVPGAQAPDQPRHRDRGAGREEVSRQRRSSGTPMPPTSRELSVHPMEVTS